MFRVAVALELGRAECGSPTHDAASRARATALATVVIIVGFLFSVAPAFADTPSPLAWSSGLVDPLPSPSPPAFAKGVSCPSSMFCAAIDASNDVITSTDPSGAWRVTPGVDTSGLQLDGVSCPSANLCVAVDLGGNVITSTDPTGGASTWEPKTGVAGPSATMGFAGISCPTTTLCVALTADGRIMHSTDPTDGATATWSSITLTPTPGSMTGISCATATLCVAVGNAVTSPNGVIYATTTPTTTVAANWALSSQPTPLQGVSCPANSFCAALANDSGDAQLITSTNPAGGSWSTPHPIETTGAVLTGISCPSATLCVAVDSTGIAFSSTDPAGGPATQWTRTVVTPFSAIGFSAVACTAEPLCVATTSSTTPSQFWTSFDPTAGQSAWMQANTAVPMYGLSCPSTSLCAAVDDIGNVVTSTDPSRGSTSWTATHAAGPTLLNISCPTTALCVATDLFGDVVTSADPTGGASGWTTSNIDGSKAIFGISCPTTAFCAAVDDAGDLLTSTNPAAGAGAWSTTDIDGNAFMTGISCPSSSFCAAVDGSGNVLVSTDPSGGAATWHTESVDAGNSPLAISCVSTAMCVAVDDAGNILSSTAPTSGSPGWTSASVDNDALEAVSCPSVTMCVAVDDSGFEINSINPAGGANEWTGRQVTASALFGVACPDTSGCSVIDAAGNAAWGAPTPSNQTLPSITGVAQQGSQLTEVHGTWTPSPTNYMVQWDRCNAVGASCSDISGATGGSYTLAAGDAGSTIRVLEVASNENGDGTTVESVQTAVVQAMPPVSSGASGPPVSPSGGAGTVTITGATTSGTIAKVRVSCTGRTGATCALTLKLTVNETIKRGKVIAVTAKAKTTVVVLGTTTITLAAGQTKVVTISLNAVGKRLLSQRRTLKVKLAITHSTTTIFNTTISFRSKPKKKH